jgi:ABC-type uncharacterized transport system permease subunit
MRTILPYALAGILYAALALHLWNTRWRAAMDCALTPGERAAILVPLILHSYLLATDILLGHDLVFGFSHAISAMLWLAVILYWIESLFLRLEGMQPFVLGLAALSAPLPMLFPGVTAPAYAHTAAFALHLILAMLAYSFFALAALHALVMALMEQQLHFTKKPGVQRGSDVLKGPLAGLPPLLTLETLMFRIVGLGFLLLTLTLITGTIFSETVFGRALQFNHKTLFALISWVIFACLLAGRRLYGWRGRIALRWTLAGFAALLLAYVGSRFVLEVILHRLPGA